MLSSNISSTCPHNMVKFGSITAESDWRVWGTPADFNGFRVFERFLGWNTIGLCSFSGVLPGAKFTLRPSLAFSCIGTATARPNFAAWYLHATGRPSRSTLGGRTI